MPHTDPVPLGINLGPERFTPQYLDRLAALHRPLLLRTAARSVGTAREVLAAVSPYPTLSVIMLVEQPDLALVAALRPLASDPKFDSIELGNELDLQGLNRYQYANFVCDAVAALATDGANVVGFPKRIISGGIYTVDHHQPDDFATYLRPMLDGCGAVLTVGLHFYGDTSDAWLARVQALTRPVMITEFGQPGDHQAPYLTEKIAAFTRLGASGAVIYQLISGPCGDTSNLANFGLLTCTDQPKEGWNILR